MKIKARNVTTIQYKKYVYEYKKIKKILKNKKITKKLIICYLTIMSFKELPIMKDKSKGVLLFYPYVSKKSASNIKGSLLEDGLDRDQWLINLKKNLEINLQKNSLQ